MHKIIYAAVLCVALSPALAADAPSATAANANGLIHASLVVPAATSPAAHRDPGTAQAQQAQAAEKDDARHDTGGGMLFAALALMLGIVLRRWGTGPQ